ncbi:hypothetical protein NP493_331g04006 [Ridgeia piscesae]|uniref:ENTH domain-containing protein n=1 Tax=Ridgeia piscesae TaxID=27915 RepID=A0AAD9L4G5_RIDPI|nr:hypothetical protein NP493_331g04006 [Ridgeia piscesae]
MWKVREIADRVTNVVMNYSEVEAKVREATNDDAWGPHGTLMQEVARYTFTYEHFPEVMGMLWKRMLHERKSWRNIYKSLLLLTYLVRNGSERVVTSTREHLYDLRQLESYTFTDEFGRDQGVNVRQKVKDLLEMVQDDDRLREERKKAKKNQDKYIGLSGESASFNRFGYSDRYDETPQRVDRPQGHMDEIDTWDKGGNKSMAQEALDKVKDFVSKVKGFDDTPDYCADDDNDDLFDDPTPSKYSQYKDAADDYSTNDYKSVERSRSSASVEEQTSPTRRARRAKPIDLGAAASYGKDSDSKSQTSRSEVTTASSRVSPSGGSTRRQHQHDNPDLLGGFSSPTNKTNANGDFADFNPRQGEATANGDFGDFSQCPTSDDSNMTCDFGVVFLL